MSLEAALAFASSRSHGVLTTLRSDGRAQLSNIFYVYANGTFRISVNDTRAKTRNLRRDPRAVLYVPGDDFWSYAVLDGTATLSEVASTVDDEVCDQLVAYFRAAVGEHPNWAEYRAAMVSEGRLLLDIQPTSAYGQFPT